MEDSGDTPVTPLSKEPLRMRITLEDLQTAKSNLFKIKPKDELTCASHHIALVKGNPFKGDWKTQIPCQEELDRQLKQLVISPPRHHDKTLSRPCKISPSNQSGNVIVAPGAEKLLTPGVLSDAKSGDSNSSKESLLTPKRLRKLPRPPGRRSNSIVGYKGYTQMGIAHQRIKGKHNGLPPQSPQPSPPPPAPTHLSSKCDQLKQYSSDFHQSYPKNEQVNNMHLSSVSAFNQRAVNNNDPKSTLEFTTDAVADSFATTNILPKIDTAGNYCEQITIDRQQDKPRNNISSDEDDDVKVARNPQSNSPMYSYKSYTCFLDRTKFPINGLNKLGFSKNEDHDRKLELYRSRINFSETVRQLAISGALKSKISIGYQSDFCKPTWVDTNSPSKPMSFKQDAKDVALKSMRREAAMRYAKSIPLPKITSTNERTTTTVNKSPNKNMYQNALHHDDNARSTTERNSRGHTEMNQQSMNLLGIHNNDEGLQKQRQDAARLRRLQDLEEAYIQNKAIADNVRQRYFK